MFLWALMASVQTLLVPVPALTVSPEVRKASLPMPALMKSALLPLARAAVSVSDKAVSSEAKTLAVPVKDIAAAIVIHKHFVRYLFSYSKMLPSIHEHPFTPLYKGMHSYLKDSSHLSINMHYCSILTLLNQLSSKYTDVFRDFSFFFTISVSDLSESVYPLV